MIHFAPPSPRDGANPERETMTTYNRAFLGLEFWAYMQAPVSVFAAMPATRHEQVPSSECLMCCGTEG